MVQSGAEKIEIVSRRNTSLVNILINYKPTFKSKRYGIDKLIINEWQREEMKGEGTVGKMCVASVEAF